RKREFSGVARLARDDGGAVTVQFAGHPEIVTGRRYVLAVALSHSLSRRPARMRPATGEELSPRETEVVDLIAHGRSGPEIAEQLKTTLPRMAILLTSTVDDGVSRARADASGAVGFVLKSDLAACDLSLFLRPRPGAAPTPFHPPRRGRRRDR